MERNLLIDTTKMPRPEVCHNGVRIAVGEIQWTDEEAKNYSLIATAEFTQSCSSIRTLVNVASVGGLLEPTESGGMRFAFSATT